jgi:tRNA(fMet)-specific endonuclease VapC
VIHLDTTFLVDLLREEGRGEPGAAHGFLEGLGEEEVAVSAHVVCELLAGAECADDPGRERARVETLLRALPVAWPDDRFPPAYASLLGELRRRGESVAPRPLCVSRSP